jgi:hypothetical protein
VVVIVRSRNDILVPAVVRCDDSGGRRRETATETVAVPGRVGSKHDDADIVLGLVEAGTARAGERRLPDVVGSVNDSTVAGEKRAVAGRVVIKSEAPSSCGEGSGSREGCRRVWRSRERTVGERRLPRC